VNPERWLRVDKIFDDLLERPLAERAIFLERACAGDLSLKREVEALMSSHEAARTFLESHAFDGTSDSVGSPPFGSFVRSSFGSYELLRLLDAGGMGEVYLAHDTRLARRVALKILHTNFASDPERRRRFLHEARAAAALNHPNIATIHEINEANGVYFIVMEYVEGETLKTKIRNKPLAQKELYSLATQIAEALRAAHSTGIIHRDLKSANIMITAQGQVKLVDFGIAKRFPVQRSSSLDLTPVETEPGVLIGTVDYMSPEQALGHQIDHRSDIFSFGVVLYEAATGTLPFSGTTPMETLNRIINTDPCPIPEMSPPISPELEQIILKCLVKDPQGRYQKATDLLEDARKVTLSPEKNGALRTRNNVPQQLTTFIGRQRELAEVTELLSKTRLLTLTGMGGIGKTRLAIQIAVDRLNDYPDGVWFVDLAALSEPNLVPQAIASVLPIQEESHRDPLQSVCDYFGDRCTLLVIDNCEHLIAACAKTSELLLQKCARLRLIATSREPLMVSGESVWRVPSLSLPDGQSLEADFLQYEAVRLFVDRATAVQPKFVLSLSNAGDVVNICRQLDGIPLAIELAAARTRALSIEEIRARLIERFRLLNAGIRTALPRQQTLRATLDWSHNLLSEKERILFRRISVFVGGFTLQAAEDICAADDLLRHEVMDVLTQLVDKSLVVFVQNNSTRYRLLETVREYGREKLDESGETDSQQKQHAEFYVRFAECGETELQGEHQVHWFQLFANDHNNIRAAFQSLKNDAGGSGAMLRMVTGMRQFWLVRGNYTEGREWAKEALERCHQPWAIQHLGTMETAGDLANDQGDHEAARLMYEEILNIAGPLQDLKWIGSGLFSLGHVALSHNDFSLAQSLYERGLSAWQRAGYRLGVAGVCTSLGQIAYTQANYSLARTYFDQSLTLFRALQAIEGTATSLMMIGHVAYIQADYTLARSLVEESLTCFRAIGSKPRVASALSCLSDIAAAEGDFGSAKSMIADSLDILRELGAKRHIASALNRLGNIAVLESKYNEGRSLYEEGLTVANTAGAKRTAADLTNGLANLARNDGRHGVALDLEKQSLTMFREMGYKNGVARSLHLIAVTMVAIGKAGRAARLFGAVEALYEAMGILPPPSERILFGYEAASLGAREILGNETFLAAKAEGRAMTVDQVTEIAFDE